MNFLRSISNIFANTLPNSSSSPAVPSPSRDDNSIIIIERHMFRLEEELKREEDRMKDLKKTLVSSRLYEGLVNLADQDLPDYSKRLKCVESRVELYQRAASVLTSGKNEIDRYIQEKASFVREHDLNFVNIGFGGMKLAVEAGEEKLAYITEACRGLDPMFQNRSNKRCNIGDVQPGRRSTVPEIEKRAREISSKCLLRLQECFESIKKEDQELSALPKNERYTKNMLKILSSKSKAL